MYGGQISEFICSLNNFHGRINGSTLIDFTWKCICSNIYLLMLIMVNEMTSPRNMFLYIILLNITCSVIPNLRPCFHYLHYLLHLQKQYLLLVTRTPFPVYQYFPSQTRHFCDKAVTNNSTWRLDDCRNQINCADMKCF